MIGTCVFLLDLSFLPSLPPLDLSFLPSLPPLDLSFLPSLSISPSFPPYLLSIISPSFPPSRSLLPFLPLDLSFLLSIISPSFPPYLQHVPSQLDHSESDFIHVYIKQNFCEITKVVKNKNNNNKRAYSTCTTHQLIA